VPWVWIFGVLAALYNPIFRCELDQSIWILVNWLTVGAILVAIGVFWVSERGWLTQAEEAEFKQLRSTPYI
jgi:hypothetical protein